MKIENILQLTAIDNKDNSTKNFYLGDWCSKYEDIINKSSPKEHHWQSDNKREKDVIYLENLYEKLLIYLKNTLNHYHQEKKDDLYWRIVLGPWLFRYITILFDKWETVKIFFSKNSSDFQVNFFNLEEKNNVRNFNDSIKFINSVTNYHEWNYLIYKEIIENYFSDKIKINKLDLNLKYEKEKNISNKKNLINFKVIKKFIKKTVINSTGHIFFLLKIKFNKLIILDLDINYGNFFKMCLALKIIPSKNATFLDNLIKINSNLYNLNLREKLYFNQKAQNTFEDFLFKNIFIDIPTPYLENYKTITKGINNILTDKKKIILCNYSHLNSDKWKIWIAEMIQRKSKLITYTHGGGLPLKTYYKFSEPKHELKISTKRITWFKYTEKDSVQLSPLKTINFKKIKYASYKNKLLSIIVPDMHLFLVNPERNPYGRENVDQIDNCFKLIKNLNPDLQNVTKFKLNSYQGVERDNWFIKRIIKEKYGNSKIIKAGTHIRKTINESKFIINLYPQTCLSETLISNIPFALFYNPSHWDVSDECEEMILLMKKNHIYFEDPKQLSDHLNKIWPTVNEWWNSQAILEVRNYLKDKTANLDKNWKNEWVNFLKNTN